ncbi:hypothetical protein FEI15_01870 [Lacticaseibacillus zeae]|uniref:DUF4352 domain-containing protein n=1 Tax=Lacticaseibacillus zeae TaxID=57037 RepID=A0A5R8LZ62_LACZE|nr:hypothetical protein [Lacticaseibacillus zeae]TLF40999.1 hypothetical protein FEI15_01870 [Lacticaseibacillus zeae]
MKKGIVIGVSAMIALSLTACSSNSASSRSTSTIRSSKKAANKDGKKVSGQLTKVGTYSVREGRKATLLKIYYPDQSLTFSEGEKQVVVDVRTVKILQNDIQDTSIKTTLEDVYKTSIPGKRFFTIQIDFKLINKLGNDAYLEGFSSLTLGDRSLGNQQFYDPTPGVTVASEAAYSNSIVAVIDKNQITLSKIGLALENIDEPGQSSMLMKPTSSQYLNLN